MTSQHQELFRADFISAMKLPDTHHLEQGSYLNIKDHWRTEWEKGVQVCVNPTALASNNVSDCGEDLFKREDFVMPPGMIPDESGHNHVPQYDLDELDLAWLETFHEKRKYTSLSGGQVLTEVILRQAIAALEIKCQQNLAYAMTTRDDLKMEMDELRGCDVCREYESEDTNEIVFCDGCNICVHQACYGIEKVPEGPWLCDICKAKEGSPKCVLCSLSKGTLKKLNGGGGWAHISCALWIPEVRFGVPERMKNIIINQVPARRWSLLCSLCRKKEGACIQCYCASCTVAYHVTCGFNHGLEMKTSPDGTKVIHESYCPKHSALRKVIRTPSPKKDLRLSEKIHTLEEHFHEHASPKDLQEDLKLNPKLSSVVYNYWKLKRKANQNRPLVAAISVDSLRLELVQQSHDLPQKRQNFQKLLSMRHDLEKARNLLYMVERREKMKKQLLIMDRQILETTLTAFDKSDKKSSLRHSVPNGSAYHDGFKTPSVPSIDPSLTVNNKHLNNPRHVGVPSDACKKLFHRHR